MAIYRDLQGQIVPVTGGGSGIGEAVVRQFAARRARVAFIDIAVEPSRMLVRDLEASGVTAHFEACDLTDIAALQDAIGAIRARLGPIPSVGQQRSQRRAPRYGDCDRSDMG